MAGTICGLFRNGMDAACYVVSVDISEKEHDVHSGGALILITEGNIPKRYLSVVFVFQRGIPTIVSVVIWLAFELKLRFCDMRGMLKCRIQTSA
jgi:hypothetical protein